MFSASAVSPLLVSPIVILVLVFVAIVTAAVLALLFLALSTTYVAAAAFDFACALAALVGDLGTSRVKSFWRLLRLLHPYPVACFPEDSGAIHHLILPWLASFKIFH